MKKVKRAIDEFAVSNPTAASLGTNLKKTNKNTLLSNGSILPSLEEVSRSAKRRYDVLDDIISLFPDIELAMQILISSIISPKDMMSQELYYKLEDLNLPAETLSGILNIIKSNMDRVYGINSKLPDIIRNVLFTRGSYCVAIIPESAVDKVLSGLSITTESLHSIETSINSRKSILGNTQETDTDISFEEIGISITDNPDTLKYSKLKRRKLELAMESTINGSNSKIINISGIITANIANISEYEGTDRGDIGRPLTLHLPSESVIPVQAAGQLDKKYGVFVLLDKNGNPITKDSVKSPEKIILSAFNAKTNSDDNTSAIIKKAKAALGMRKADNKSVPEIVSFYQNIVMSKLEKSLLSGIYDGAEVSISDASEIYKIMLARALSARQTKVLYIPSDYIVYYAHSFYQNGVGKSLTDDLMVISSIRAMSLFAKLMAMVKNSIPATKVRVSLDEDDPDPDKTIDAIMAMVLNNQQTYLPIGTTNIADITDWATRLGYEFEFTGHPRIPTTTIDYESAKINHEVPDDDLDEDLRKRSYMALSLTPEIVDNGYAGDFATTVVANNILLSKRVSMYQTTFNKYITEHVSKLVKYDANIKQSIRKVLESSIDEIYKRLEINKTEVDVDTLTETVIEAVRRTIRVYLPSPQSTTLQNLSERFDEYKNALEEAIEAVLKEEILDPELAGEIGDKLPIVMEAYKAYFLRKWMSDNNYMPELFDMLNEGNNGKVKLDIDGVTAKHSEKLAESIMKYVTRINKAKKKYDRKLNKLDSDEGHEAPTTVQEPATDGEDTGF